MISFKHFNLGFLNENNKSSIKFGRLFDIYTVISNKVVGILLRARKYGFVDFQGETLFQRRNDDTIITLLMPASKVKEIAKESTSDNFTHFLLEMMGFKLHDSI